MVGFYKSCSAIPIYAPNFLNYDLKLGVNLSQPSLYFFYVFDQPCWNPTKFSEIMGISKIQKEKWNTAFKQFPTSATGWPQLHKYLEFSIGVVTEAIFFNLLPEIPWIWGQE